jgi:hypothetical protein
MYLIYVAGTWLIVKSLTIRQVRLVIAVIILPYPGAYQCCIIGHGERPAWRNVLVVVIRPATVPRPNAGCFINRTRLLISLVS